MTAILRNTFTMGERRERRGYSYLKQSLLFEFQKRKNMVMLFNLNGSMRPERNSHQEVW